jgi:hypothetical protein
MACQGLHETGVFKDQLQPGFRAILAVPFRFSLGRIESVRHSLSTRRRMEDGHSVTTTTFEKNMQDRQKIRTITVVTIAPARSRRELTSFFSQDLEARIDEAR